MGGEFAAGTWPTLWLLVAVAAFGCVPETDHLELIGGVLGGLLMAELVNRRPFNWGVQTACALVLVWAVLHGAVGRDRAIVGGLFAFWPVLLAGGWWFLAPASGRRRTVWIPIVLGGAGALVVSRTGALEPGWGPALRSVLIWSSVSVVVSGGALVRLRSAGARQPSVSVVPPDSPDPSPVNRRWR